MKCADCGERPVETRIIKGKVSNRKICNRCQGRRRAKKRRENRAFEEWLSDIEAKILKARRRICLLRLFIRYHTDTRKDKRSWVNIKKKIPPNIF